MSQTNTSTSQKPAGSSFTRREFLGTGALALAATAFPTIIPSSALGKDGAVAPSNRITVGVIGCGPQGRGDMRNFLNQTDCRVVAVCDVKPDQLALAKKAADDQYKNQDCKTYRDFREIIGRKDIDACLIATPDHWHVPASLLAVNAGKDIYTEKPLGLSLEEDQVLRAAVHRKKRVFQFGTQQRSDIYFRWASELALNGRLGKLKEIQVGVEGGREAELFPEQPVPPTLDWDRWVGPAPMTPFHENKAKRAFHENITNFSLGMISCWGIHHLDIAQWGNGTDATGPTSVEGSATYPKSGSCDAVLNWMVRMEYASAAPIIFATQGQEIGHGVRFIGEDFWVHVVRGSIKASDPALLRDPQNAMGTMPIKLPVSKIHTDNFIEAIRAGTRAICDIDTAVRSDMLPQLTAMALKVKRKLTWDPATETFRDDTEANALLAHRPFRGDWKLPAI